MHRYFSKMNVPAALFAAAIAVVLALPQSAVAFPSFAGAVTTRYPSATRLGNCGTCHGSFTKGQGLNPYGIAFADAGGTGNQDAAFAAIEGDDSDGDGETNLAEIMSASGFEPGWDCDTYETAADAPGDLADYVDVNDVGCLGVTTTTTNTLPPTTSTSTTSTTLSTTTTSTTTSTTSTTLSTTTTSSTTTTTVSAQACSQPLTDGALPTSTDCLYILNAAVGLETCSPECICAPSGMLPVSATDALVCLNSAVGVPVSLNCPCGS